MTAPVAAAAAGEGAAAAGAGEATAARAAPASAPTGSAPVGTAGSSAGSSGSSPRTQNQLRGPRPKGGTAKGGGSASPRSSRSSTSSARSGSSGSSRRRNSGPAILSPGGRGGKHHGGSLNLKGRGRKLLLAEFILCAVIVALSPLTDKHKTDSPGDLMKRNTAIGALFLLLALLSTAGRGASRVAAAFGGLVTVALLVSERDVFVKVAERFHAPTTSAGPAGPPGGGGADGDFGNGGGGPVPGTGTGGGGEAAGPFPELGGEAPGNLPNLGLPPTAPSGSQPWWWPFVGGLGPL